MRILLTNDDGIEASGLHSMYRGLIQCGHDVVVIAPKTHQSAVSAHISLYSRLTLEDYVTEGFKGMSLTGTPADCVLLGLKYFFRDQAPDMVVSGINSGHNVGIEALYSGTVNAAHQGTSFGIPSVAVSRWRRGDEDLEAIGLRAAEIIGSVRWSALKKDLTWNLNFPPMPVKELKGVRPATISGLGWNLAFREDPTAQRSFRYANIPFNQTTDDLTEGNEVQLLNEGYVTLTALALPSRVKSDMDAGELSLANTLFK